MDALTQPPQWGTPQAACAAPHENDRFYTDWFRVSGDVDDFIFYGEDTSAVSER